jgi:hypothetical protein
VEHVIHAILVEVTKDFRENEEGRKTCGPLRLRWLEDAENDVGEGSPRSGGKAKDGEVVSGVVNGTKCGRRAWGYD